MDASSDAYIYALAHTRVWSDIHPVSDVYPLAYAHAHAETDTYHATYAYTLSDVYPVAYAYSYTYTGSRRHTNASADAGANSHTDANPDCHTGTDTDFCSEMGRFRNCGRPIRGPGWFGS